MNTRFAAVVFAFLILAIVALLPVIPEPERTTRIVQTNSSSGGSAAYHAMPADSIAAITIACLIIGAAAIGRIFFSPNRKAARKAGLASA